MAEAIRMPKMSDTMTEGVIASWLKQVGDKVKSGDVLAEVETDKATMELESYEDGTLLYIGPKKGDAVPVDALIAVIGKEGEDISSIVNGGGSQATAPKQEAQAAAPKQEAQPATAQAPAAKPAAPAQGGSNGAASQSKAAPAKPAANIKASVIRMPKMSDTMQEGVIASWQKKVGDKVKSGDVLAEVETDKATMELESYEDGTLLYIGHEAGQSVPVNGVLAVIGEQGADFQALLDQESNGGANAGTDVTPATEAAIEDSRVEQSATQPQLQNEAQATGQAAPSVSQMAPGLPGAAPQAQAATSGGTDGRIFISPLARKMAEERGIDLGQVRGSGENGRIVRRDIENFQPSAAPQPAARPQGQPAQQAQPQGTPATAAAPAAAGEGRFTEQPVSQMRKVIARRLAESKFTAPHFYLTMAIDMDVAWATREKMNAMSPVKISFNDIVIKAAAAALRQHPAVNSSWLGDTIRFNQEINIGVAVAVEDGLLVPVVRNADQKPLSQIASEVKDFGARAKSKKLQPQDWAGNTFTISNLGMFGIEEFTAIINPPDACILAVGAIQDVPVVRNGQIMPGKVMKVTMSCDHRVVDGAVGSAFLQTLKQLLEDPIRMLV